MPPRPPRKNRLKAKWQAGEVSVGILVGFGAPAVVEMAGLLGFDWVFIDAEHGPMDYETCEHMVRAAETVGITPIIRLPLPDPRLVNRYLDTGALGVLVPHLDSAATARAVVAEGKYRPLGNRGAGQSTRAADFGQQFSAAEYTAWANEETMLFGILEDAGVLDELPEILQVEGFDGFTIGHSDLSQSMGLDVHDPRVQETIAQMQAMVLDSGKALCRVPTGAGVALEETEQFLADGVRLVAANFMTLFAPQARRFVALAQGG